MSTITRSPYPHLLITEAALAQRPAHHVAKLLFAGVPYQSVWNEPSYLLSLAGMTDYPMSVRPGYMPTMCGGRITSISGHRGDPPRDAIEVTPLRKRPLDSFDMFNAGIIHLLATLTREEATVWVPVLRRAVNAMTKVPNFYYSVTSASQPTSKEPRTKKARRLYMWIIHAADDTAHNLYAQPKVVRCLGCGAMIANDWCSNCSNYTRGHSGFQDDVGLVLAKGTQYADDARFRVWRNRLSAQRHGDLDRAPGVAYISSWAEGHVSANGEVMTSVLRILWDMALQYGQVPVITSNVGAAPYKTAKIMAFLYNNQEELRKYGLRLVTPKRFATNPREHYHYIDSMMVVQTSRKKVRDAMRELDIAP